MSTLNQEQTSDEIELMDMFAEMDRRKARYDPVYFVRQFCMTFDPRPEAYPHIIDFDPYGFQEDLILQFVDDIRNSRDDFIEKSRDMGVSWIIIAVLLWFWLFEPGFQALIGTYIEDFVDNGELDSLFGKLVFLIEHVKDKKILPTGFVLDKHKTYASLTNPENGNAILGKAPTRKFGRSGRYTVVLFDEIGFWQWARQAWAAAGDSARCRIAITTPPDEPSYAKTLRFSGKIHVTTLHWSLHPNKDTAWYEAEKNRRTEEEILHEIDISWEYSSTARVYPESDNMLYQPCRYNPSVPLYVSIDLGLDMVSLIWLQPVPNTDYWAMLTAYEREDTPIEWWLPFFGFPIDSQYNFVYTDEDLAQIAKVKLWKKGMFFGDPSGEQRHVEDPKSESAYKKLRKKGIYVQSNPASNDFKTRRNATKVLLPKLLLNDDPGVKWWHECMKQAHYPKRAEESNTTSGIVKPVHDWTSHLRTATEFFAVNYKLYPVASLEQTGSRPVRERNYDSSGRYLG